MWKTFTKTYLKSTKAKIEPNYTLEKRKHCLEQRNEQGHKHGRKGKKQLHKEGQKQTHKQADKQGHKQGLEHG